MKRLIVGTILVFLTLSYAGTRAAVDHKAGPGTMHEATGEGFQSAKDTLGEIFQVPAIVVESAKPGAMRLGQQFGGVLNGVTGAPTAPTAPPQWDNRVTPSDQGAGN